MKSVMQRIVSNNRILGLLVLALSLHAVCPATEYTQRLELFNPTAAPADVLRSNPAPPISRVGWAQTGVASSELGAGLSPSEFRSSQIVHAAIPIYQKASPVADASQPVEDPYESSLYSSCFAPRESGRGPPCLIS